MHRPQQEGGAADPVGQGRAIECDALPRIDLSLPIQRQMIRVFGDENLRHRRLGWQPALNQPRRRGRLHHPVLASPAGIFGPTHNKHAELSRDDVKSFTDILAKTPTRRRSKLRSQSKSRRDYNRRRMIVQWQLRRTERHVCVTIAIPF